MRRDKFIFTSIKQIYTFIKFKKSGIIKAERRK